MFTRTLSVGSVLEVRPSANTASPCIRGSARLQIGRLLSCGTPMASRTGSWRHLRTCFRDPPHCSVIHQYPGLLGLLEHPRIDTSAAETSQPEVGPTDAHLRVAAGEDLQATSQPVPDVADDSRHAAAVGMHGSDRSAAPSSMSAANAVRDLFISRAAHLAPLTRPPHYGLERRFAELVSENQQLKDCMTAASLRIQKVQDLNLRLCSELKQVRGLHNAEHLAAVRHISNLRHQMRRRGLRLRRQLRLRSCRRARARLAKASRQHVLQEAHRKVEQADLVPVESAENQLEELDGADVVATCTCGDLNCFGCTLHRTYSSALLLAHRDASRRISLGAPGLELPSAVQSIKWHLLALPKAQEKPRYRHARRQERIQEHVVPDRPPGL